MGEEVRRWNSTFRAKPARLATRAPLNCKRPMKRGKRIRAKSDPKLSAWSRAVKKRDNNQCQAQKFCGVIPYEFGKLPCFGPLDSHHIAERSLRPDLKYDVTNGIALCRAHHDWIPLNRKEAIRIGLLSTATYEAANKI